MVGKRNRGHETPNGNVADLGTHLEKFDEVVGIFREIEHVCRPKPLFRHVKMDGSQLGWDGVSAPARQLLREHPECAGAHIAVESAQFKGGCDQERMGRGAVYIDIKKCELGDGHKAEVVLRRLGFRRDRACFEGEDTQSREGFEDGIKVSGKYGMFEGKAAERRERRDLLGHDAVQIRRGSPLNLVSDKPVRLMGGYHSRDARHHLSV